MKYKFGERYLQNFTAKPKKPDDIPNTLFWCCVCYEIFPKGMSDEECLAEAKIHFPDENLEEGDLTCDDCFKKVMAFNNHEIGGPKK